MHQLLPLCKLKKGQWARIEDFLDTVALHMRIRFQEIGLKPGALVQFIRSAPCGGPLHIKVGQAFLALRQTEAALLQVKLV
jgi:Fe2+ transport system protein FeoA